MSRFKNFDLSLRIDVPFDTRNAANGKASEWPLPDEFPIVIDSDGHIVSRYSDSKWHLWPWAKRPILLNFGDGPQRKGAAIISKPNANVLRSIAAWLIYSPSGTNRPTSLIKQISDIKPIFVECTKQSILVTDLVRYPRVIEEISASSVPGRARALRTLLHLLYEWREEIGFMILDPLSIKKLVAGSPVKSSIQTAYIPPRIWKYQLCRLREFLEEFHTHREKIEECFARCVYLYSNNYGGLANAFQGERRSPFTKPRPSDRRHNKPFYAGPFSETAEKYGVAELLLKWVGDPEKGIEGPGRGVIMLSSYLTMATYASIAYMLNFSMMRIKEVWDLRCNCLVTENDPNFGKFFLLCGVTTKTIDDDDARWVTSPSAELAVKALSCISRLRISCAIENPALLVEPEDVVNPWLVCRSYEPWAGAINVGKTTALRPNYPSYDSIVRSYPKLFDSAEIRITEKDIEDARRVTIGLDSEKFKVGISWCFTWHQLRRTGAVNMQGSDLVSIPSMQYQLKHETRAMSLYYGRGYSAARLNNVARNEFLDAMYDLLSMKAESLQGPDFISIHGQERKASLLAAANLMDPKQIALAVKRGEISWRPTFFGGCMKSGPCPYGGVDNFIRCGGGDGKSPCIDGIIDRSRVERLEHARDELQLRLTTSSSNSPLHHSLLAQIKAIKNVLLQIGNDND
ncbi:hypothetical protein [Pseudomonas canadensis]|uniref:hypothetical protein n=1 Tax=Pseudomonas canadensis TaxID=915099 RepID=UPI002733D887|nr:hypothetical protein [Pseudomonas canadensis]WLH29936.1 hypothetical protein PSH56_28570 [Pseudomonas canadensis]